MPSIALTNGCAVKLPSEYICAHRLLFWAFVRDASFCSRKRDIQRFPSLNAEEELAMSSCPKRGKSCERLSSGHRVAITLVTSQQLQLPGQVQPSEISQCPSRQQFLDSMCYRKGT